MCEDCCLGRVSEEIPWEQRQIGTFFSLNRLMVGCNDMNLRRNQSILVLFDCVRFREISFRGYNLLKMKEARRFTARLGTELDVRFHRMDDLAIMGVLRYRTG